MGGAEGDSTTPEREVAGAGTRTAALPVPAAGWVQAEAEGVRLRALVGHAHAVPSSATVEDAVALFERHRIDFLAVVDAGKWRGLCARRTLTATLGSRFGFALHARRPIAEHLLPAPLRVEPETGLTDVFKAVAARSEREFYDDVALVEWDGRFLGLISMQVLARLQTEFLLGNLARVDAARREIAEKNRQMEDDLRVAREVQFAMLPAGFAPLEFGTRRLILAHRYQPAGGLSGDFFAVLRIAEGTLGVLICDVMGHGVRSALITAMVRAMLEQLRPVAADPGRLLSRLNRDLTRILRQAGGLIFVTAAYVVVDGEAGVLRYAQAGHPTPLQWDARLGRMRAIAVTREEAGPALGLVDDFDYLSCAEAFAPGDRVVLFTDGVCEAASVAGEEFGEANMAQSLTRRFAEPLDDWLGGLLQEASRFAGGRFTDDVCLVGFELGALEASPAAMRQDGVGHVSIA
jgi:serine phosphatase RsbU (regulator of sigma subunit)